MACVHVFTDDDGKIIKVFVHLTNLPPNSVVHLSQDAIYSFEEFASSHPRDTGEIYHAPCREFFDLGDESIVVDQNGD